MISIILAAGKGTRMKSNISKLMHKVNGQPMIVKLVKTLDDAGINKNILILGYLKEQILEVLDLEHVVQEQQLGTAHAVMIAKDKILENNDDILICNGDGPLLTVETINRMKEKFKNDSLDALILSCEVNNPHGYGRIIKENGRVTDIIEEIDTTIEQKNIKEINAGVYLFKRTSLLSILDKFNNDNKKGEYYLTDAVKLLNAEGLKVDSLVLEDEREMLGVNSKSQLAMVSKILRDRKNEKLMDDGVILIDPNTTYIEEDVEIGQDSVIYPNVYIEKGTKIGSNCTIYSGSRIESSTIGNNVSIDNSVVEQSIIEDNVSVGPFAHIRPNSLLKEKSKVGNFVEIKKSILHPGVKCGHLTYIGDSEVGENTNIGAGTITCNYDGVKKHKTNIGKDCFIGSNSILVSPVNIGNNVLTAAGSVITNDIPEDSIAFGRARQVNKIGINKK
ncbi:bifunctional UDP-N-acetylglucosamine diphosphorylase/glucosamine-1-phosphate N-acetyltransferase GlmU [Streptobacillus felis]|uniref:Bifunctional protein GlmU n=1 Tax=Streptobacillus felis TaxID=1384509 RepID=A0A7Z0TAV0_9FUSO|nr:bifunctional UDP-N-acetylglucosamine diphosphorylase/glucosamine-1-phosphate N-acetyltransferase GlmU [Streptobacillus felis]NYV28385.1 bifunctional UDP-N-acetylglucosamine diphosphorylase/glucosamine-1-phosphate N-acetyltransferase GlmU [Streptobacillus felis]